MLKDPAPHHHGPFFGSDAAQVPTGGTRLFRPQELGLLLRGRLERSRSQSPGGSHGHFLHLGQIDVQPRPGFAEGTPDHDFSPALGDAGNRRQIFGSQLP